MARLLDPWFAWTKRAQITQYAGGIGARKQDGTTVCFHGSLYLACLMGILAADVINTFERWLGAGASVLFARELELLRDRFSIAERWVPADVYQTCIIWRFGSINRSFTA